MQGHLSQIIQIFLSLQIRNPILYEVNVTSFDQSESHTVSPVSNELKPLLERPLKFEYKEGKVGQIFCNDDEPEYILNIKRGVLSMIHHNFTKPESSLHHRAPRLYKNWEVSWKVSHVLDVLQNGWIE